MMTSIRDCVASRCPHFLRGARLRCTHPDCPPKKTWKHIPGTIIYRLEKCPKGDVYEYGINILK